VNSTEVVAIIGAGSTFAVAVAGYVFSYYTARRQEAGQLARDAQQREHERELARGARLFDRRAPVYEEMVRFLNVWQDRVEATEPIIEFAGGQATPNPPDFEEWRAMQARLGTYGSVAVAGAYRKYWEAIIAFYKRVDELRMIRNGHAEGSLADAGTRVEEARKNVWETLKTLETLVSEELAAL
jgi:hypothetical protein